MRKNSEEKPKKGIEVILNGQPVKFDIDNPSWNEIVDKAFPDGGRGKLIEYTVLFEQSDGPVSEGTLHEGEHVSIKDGTEISVKRTDRS